MSTPLERIGWKPSASPDLSPDRIPGRVIATFGTASLVQTHSMQADCVHATRFRGRPASERPTVGDFVAIDADNVVQEVLPRLASISRKAAGARTDEQVLAANVDISLCALAVNLDRFRQRIERYVIASWDAGVEPVLVLTKADLARNIDAILKDLSVYGTPIIATSAVTGSGIEEIRSMIAPDRTAVLLGPSGIGKSSLINRLVEGADLDTGEERASDHRGRHTTTIRSLIALEAGGAIIDTPGLREFQLWNEEGVDRVFDDVVLLIGSCRFRDCHHETEPGCAVIHAIEHGELDPDRLERYRKLQREVARSRRRRDQRAAMEEKRTVRAKTMRLRRESKEHRRARGADS